MADHGAGGDAVSASAAERGTIPRISHVLETSLYVADLDRSQRFYEGLFGFPCAFRNSRMCALEVPGGQMLLLFRQGGSVQPSRMPQGVVPAHDGTGNLHLAFAIPQRALDEWADHLARSGVAVESRIAWPQGGISLYFRDPDGHSLEVATPGLWPNR